MSLCRGVSWPSCSSSWTEWVGVVGWLPHLAAPGESKLARVDHTHKLSWWLNRPAAPREQLEQPLGPGEFSRRQRTGSYFGWTLGSPPGLPGGGMTGIGIDLLLAGGFTTPRSPVIGGRITPSNWQPLCPWTPAGSSGFAGGSQGSACAGGVGGCAWVRGIGPLCAIAMQGTVPPAKARESRANRRFAFMLRAFACACLLCERPCRPTSSPALWACNTES